ncbi:helix-turn-helix domain-containing protein [Mycobacterium uberis]|uniref:helix-turn-helix domain-containing protein n=1 Tax=Mycobacterium uberis TaxID=2162698 RepID=UPI000E309F7D|nr:helix-turn-helix domain-containing protein [Mycobacterium uberis]
MLYLCVRKNSAIGVLDKAVALLYTIAESPCGLAKLCDQTGLPRATTYRLTATLEVHRLVARDDEGRQRLDLTIWELAIHVNDPLLAADAAVLSVLCKTTGENVQLYRRESTSWVCVAALELPAGLRDTVPIGALLPITIVVAAISVSEPIDRMGQHLGARSAADLLSEAEH